MLTLPTNHWCSCIGIGGSRRLQVSSVINGSAAKVIAIHSSPLIYQPIESCCWWHKLLLLLLFFLLSTLPHCGEECSYWAIILLMMDAFLRVFVLQSKNEQTTTINNNKSYCYHIVPHEYINQYGVTDDTNYGRMWREGTLSYWRTVPSASLIALIAIISCNNFL